MERSIRAAFKTGNRSGHIIHPLNSKAVYSDEKFPTALLRAHADPYANVRRPWVLVKFGRRTLAIREEDVVWTAVSKIYDALGSHQVMLEEAPLYYSLGCVNTEEVLNEMQHRLHERNKGLFPLAGSFLPAIRERFSNEFYIFELRSEELADIAASTAERPYENLSEWCREFSLLIKQTEGGQITASNVEELLS
ncbi:hypothetical protein COOONC_03985 [Cooperia oncophora]